MTEGKKSFMVVERRLSPPDAYKSELIYCGEEISLSEISKKLDLKPKEARKYFYTISKIEKEDGKLKISKGVFNYNEIQSGRREYSGQLFPNILELSLEEDVGKKLVDLLNS